MIQYPVDENILFRWMNSTETVVSIVNQGVRAIFKKKQDWIEERLRRLNMAQGLPTLHRPASDQKNNSIDQETDGNNQAET